jgi:hypothetical protein
MVEKAGSVVMKYLQTVYVMGMARSSQFEFDAFDTFDAFDAYDAFDAFDAFDTFDAMVRWCDGAMVRCAQGGRTWARKGGERVDEALHIIDMLDHLEGQHHIELRALLRERFRRGRAVFYAPRHHRIPVHSTPRSCQPLLIYNG